MSYNQDENFYKNYSARTPNHTPLQGTFNDRYNTSSHPVTKDRGGCLSVFLILLGFINVVGTVFLLTQSQSLSDQIGPNMNRGYIDFVNFVAVALTVVVLIAIAGLWNYKRWGYYLLGLCYGANCLFNLCGGNIVGLMVSGGILGFLIFLVNDIEYMLE